MLSAASLENGGVNSSIGAATSDEANLVLNGGTLRFVGVGVNGVTDHKFTLGANGGTIDNGSLQNLIFSNQGNVALSGVGSRSLTLTGTTDSAFYSRLGDNGGATSLTIGGTSGWTIANTNTYSGATTINSGARLSVADNVSLGTHGTLGTGDIINNGELRFEKLDVATVANNISGSGQVRKYQDADLYFTGDSTYTGTTQVFGGALFVTGSLVSAVTVNPNTILGGNGFVGDVDIHTGGLSLPADGIFSMGSLSLDSTSVVEMEINGPNAGDDYSQFIASGPISLGNAQLHLQMSSGYTPAAGKVFLLAQNDSNVAVSGTFKDLPEGSLVFLNGGPLQISYVGGGRQRYRWHRNRQYFGERHRLAR